MKTIISKLVIKSEVFFNKRLLAVLLLGFSAGIPLALTGANLTMWLARLDIDVKTIGLFALVTVPFSFKYLWSFIFDNFSIKTFSKKFGFRKSWLILIQVCLMISIILLGCSSPKENIILTAILAIIVSFFSASQDIIIDALRIESLKKEEQGLGISLYVYGYRFAMLLSGAGSLLLSDYLSWDLVYVIMSLAIIIGMIAVFLIEEPKYSAERIINENKINLIEKLKSSIIEPFIDFMSRPKWLYILLFIIFYRFADTLLISLQSKFYVHMGFSNGEIAYISKILGFIMTMVGLFFGGFIFYRLGTFTSLLIAGILQISSNLLFIWVAAEQHNLFALSVTIAIENFCGALNNVVIIAYLSNLCNIAYTATQYALLSSFANFGRTLLAAPAGYIVAALGWNMFFVITAIAGIPAIVLLFVLKGTMIIGKQIEPPK